MDDFALLWSRQSICTTHHTPARRHIDRSALHAMLHRENQHGVTKTKCTSQSTLRDEMSKCMTREGLPFQAVLLSALPPQNAHYCCIHIQLTVPFGIQGTFSTSSCTEGGPRCAPSGRRGRSGSGADGSSCKKARPESDAAKRRRQERRRRMGYIYIQQGARVEHVSGPSLFLRSGRNGGISFAVKARGSSEAGVTVFRTGRVTAQLRYICMPTCKGCDQYCCCVSLKCAMQFSTADSRSAHPPFALCCSPRCGGGGGPRCCSMSTLLCSLVTYTCCVPFLENSRPATPVRSLNNITTAVDSLTAAPSHKTDPQTPGT